MEDTALTRFTAVFPQDEMKKGKPLGKKKCELHLYVLFSISFFFLLC